MNYTIVDSAEWMYPDVSEYASATKAAELISLRGGIASFQLLITSVPAGGAEICAKGFPSECEICVYRLKSVAVEKNPGFDGTPLTAGAEGFNSPDGACAVNGKNQYQPCRTAPYRVYDCVCPLGNAHYAVYSVDGGIHPFSSVHTGEADAGGIAALYITVRCLEPGAFSASVSVCADGEELSVPVSMRVINAPVPAETLRIAVGYYPGQVEQYHSVKGNTAEFNALEEKYLRLMRRSRQNVLYVDGPEPVPAAYGGVEFDFHRMERRVRRGMELGFEYFFINGLGFRRSWDGPDIIIRGMNSESAEGIEYTERYLTALREFLAARGWTDRFAMGVADEPNEADISTYLKLCRRIKGIFPELKLYDAVSYMPGLRGALDICVPRDDEYETHRAEFDEMRGSSELWHYVCLFPRGGGYVNRFLDMPLLAARYLLWGNYSRRLSGFLHWSVNCWMDGQDPFECNCPPHVNAGSGSILPPGDSHSVYPGSGEPWMSMRLEMQREGAEEYEMLCAVSRRDSALADRLCGECFRSFYSVEYGIAEFRRVRGEILEEYGKMFSL